MRKTIRNFVIKLFNKAVFNHIARGYNILAKKRLQQIKLSYEKLTKSEIKQIDKIFKVLNTKYTYDWHLFYKNAGGRFNPKFIPDDLFHAQIESSLNPLLYLGVLDHKGLYQTILSYAIQPITYINNIEGVYYNKRMECITRNEAFEILNKAERFIIKPSIGTGGGTSVQLVELFTLSQIEKNDKLNYLFNQYKTNYIVQEVVEQNEETKRFHPNSLNTIRIMSLFLNDNVTILSAVLRIGTDGRTVDNYSSGGILVGIDTSTGKLASHAIDNKIVKYYKSPSGIPFEGCVLNSFDKIKEKVIEYHKQLPLTKIIAWDFAVTANNAIMFIENNLATPEIDFLQYFNGPLFGDRTEEVIEYVKNNPPKRLIYG
jgi:Sugar-transfer associated ATP-grasp